jgi:1-deoxy-D-xylulose-5-phosphate reductoisomerase
MQSVLILGSTGSVGKSTLDVVALHPDKFSIYALTANKNVEAMLAQCQAFKPRYALLTDPDAVLDLKQRIESLNLDTQVLSAEDLDSLCTEPNVETVMSAIVGAAGLLPTLAAVEAGKRVLIANKEPLVMTGQLFAQSAEQSGATILPIDSEHNAIFQCLQGNQASDSIRCVHLTGSGGPFRGRAWSSLNEVTVEQACNHPNWSMGQKISVDSATMMNKGLEYLEAVSLFGLEVDKLKVLLHPQSIIHSMVEYVDGSHLAQLGAPDMRIPIAHALAYPNRIESGVQGFELPMQADLQFEEPDLKNMPCLALAMQVAQQLSTGDQVSPIVLNAANEVAVEAFLSRQIKFTQIAEIVDSALQSADGGRISGIEQVLTIDNETRVACAKRLNS